MYKLSYLEIIAHREEEFERKSDFIEQTLKKYFSE